MLTGLDLSVSIMVNGMTGYLSVTLTNSVQQSDL